MLSILHIENIAVIESAEILFEDGLNVLTGEAGAGKSIIFDAISAIMGNRTSKELIRSGADKGYVSAIFTGVTSDILNRIEELGLLLNDDRTVHIQRELSLHGKNICRINMRPVSLSVLKEIGGALINIHGQNEGNKLLNTGSHIAYLDEFCKNSDILAKYSSAYMRLIDIRNKIASLEEKYRDNNQRIDFLNFAINEIRDAQLEQNEDVLLKEKKLFADNALRIMDSLKKTNYYINGGDDFDGILSFLGDCIKEISTISNISQEFGDILTKLHDSKYNIEDALECVNTSVLNSNASDIDIDYIEGRISLIYNLKRKYGNTVNDILEFLKKSEEELAEISNYDIDIEGLKKQYSDNLDMVKILAKDLSDARVLGADRLRNLIEQELSDLDMGSVSIQIRVEETARLNNSGYNKVEFLISTIPGDELRPIGRIASGGELSRIVLAIKSVIFGGDDAQTMVFDEIDTGVSGRIAYKISQKLYDISKRKQVLCITHLSQMAAMAEYHFLIEKEFRGNSAYTVVRSLSNDERCEEIARISSGDEITDIALKNAREILEHSENYKKNSKKR